MPTPPTLDGVLSPGEWPEAALREGFVDSETGAPSPTPGRFWLAYDHEFIYYAARLELDPRRIMANEFKQNAALGGDDQVQLTIEPFGEVSAWNTFMVNPRGATQLRIAGGRAAKLEWLGTFRAKAKVDAEGWVAEARVPWAVMKMPSAGTRTMRFNFIWNRNDVQRTFVHRFNGGDASRSPKWVGVEVPDIPRTRSVQLLPYGYIGRQDEGDFLFNTGLDLKTEVGPDVQLVGTINPDFRNIENQILSLDFSYFERLAGESRPFFQEGQGFRFADDLFASQRLDSFDVGINTYGNLGGKTQFGLLSTTQFGEEQALVAAVGHQLTDTVDLGGTYVGYDSQDAWNHAYRVGGAVRTGNWESYFGLQRTMDSEQGEGQAWSLGTNASAGVWRGGVNLNAVSADFFPRIGFAPERDYKGYQAWGEWSRVHPRGMIMETELGFEAMQYWRSDGSGYRRNFGINTSITSRNRVDWDMGFNFGEFEEFDDHRFWLSVEHPRRDNYRRWSFDFSKGRLQNEDYQSMGFGIAYRPVQMLQTRLSYQIVDHFDHRTQLIFSANYDLNAFDAVGGRVVSRDGETGGYVSFRRSGGLGTEYFLILGNPNSRTFEKTVILKVVVPLTLRL